jgi:hypothetical protein
MRYQQKQMHENAQKKSDMFDETQKLLTSSLGAGKVRIKRSFLLNLSTKLITNKMLSPLIKFTHRFFNVP